MKYSTVLLMLLASATVCAEPPLNHPSPAQAREMLMLGKTASTTDLPNEGKVVSTMDANEFTYVEVERKGNSEWIAAPKMPLKPGSTIRYEEGAVMSNFYSKLLKRTFLSVMFVNDIIIAAEPK